MEKGKEFQSRHKYKFIIQYKGSSREKKIFVEKETSILQTKISLTQKYIEKLI